MINFNEIYKGDSALLLKELSDNTIDAVITSPPYDSLRKYNGVGYTWNHEKFQQIAKELFRVLKDGGVVVWVVNDKTENGSKTCTSFRQTLYFKDIGFNINDVMIWRKTNPMPQVKQNRYSDVFEYMIILSKGKVKTFNPIMEACKTGGLSYNSTAKNMDGESGRHKLSYIINKEKVMGNVWDIAIAQNKTSHPAVFPIEIPLRHIKTWTNEGDVVLDPFLGSGTTAIAAIQTKRQFIGFEMNEEYYDISKERINKELNKLKYD